MPLCFRIKFVNEFVIADKGKLDRRRSKGEVVCGKPLEPTCVYDILSHMKSAENSFLRGRQEDAEEFLSCLLNTLHEEMTEAIKQSKTAEGTTLHYSLYNATQ